MFRRRRRLTRRHKTTLRCLYVLMAGARERWLLAEEVEKLTKRTRLITQELEEAQWWAMEEVRVELEAFDTLVLSAVDVTEWDTLAVSQQLTRPVKRIRLWDYIGTAS